MMQLFGLIRFLCASYGWAWLRPEAAKTMTNLAIVNGFAFLGGYILRSADGGHHWEQTDYATRDSLSECAGHGWKTRVCDLQSRAMCEGRKGELFWVVANSDINKLEKTATYLLISPQTKAALPESFVSRGAG